MFKIKKLILRKEKLLKYDPCQMSCTRGVTLTVVTIIMEKKLAITSILSN